DYYCSLWDSILSSNYIF
nr:immunoglobulin light chain junction region [Macaca mulatta]MOW57809.1 immunoglobulin light chain junction region [Macaca mulatta]MOW57844.1 immunoglobulin light chain junction region [Macaca mulatta]MOW58212.1 immunoglobulin light chain junction region [Macaca mulatta]MOW58964.1 immunoglobulin light chain junction region [Macaca mulatta]